MNRKIYSWFFILQTNWKENTNGDNIINYNINFRVIGIKNYIKVKYLESRTEKTFIEVEKTLNTLERRINNGNVRW